MQTLTQRELIIEWLKAYGEITPAKMAGKIFMGQMFGSETTKRCREMRKRKELMDAPDGKFVKFFLPGHQRGLF